MNRSHRLRGLGNAVVPQCGLVLGLAVQSLAAGDHRLLAAP